MSLRPDIAIIQECAEPDIVRAKAPEFVFTDCDWTGNHKDKGLGVFAFGPYSLRQHHSFDPSHQIFLPVEVRGPSSFNLLAVWAHWPRKRGKRAEYRGPSLNAIDHYSAFLKKRDTVLAGDFNNSHFWDKPGKAANYSEVVSLVLDRFGLESAYHHAHRVEMGQEPSGTLFFRRKADAAYHIDYCFLPATWRERIQEVTLGSAEEWIALSDHAPIAVDVKV